MPATATKKPAAKKAAKAKDEQAIALAAAARDLARAAGLKSAYSAGEARGVLDAMTVAKARGVLTVTRDSESHRIKVAALKALLDGEKGVALAEAAKLMRTLSVGLPGTMYGRKTAAFVLALSA